MQIIHAFLDPEGAFLRVALCAILLASIAFGVIGSYVVAKRISYIAGAISHSVLGGIGLSLYLSYRLGWSIFHPLVGALAAALLSAVTIGFVSLRMKAREETVIGAIWAIGMAIGLIFIAKTPGYADPMSYLFGNILMISAQDLWWLAALDVVIIFTGVLWYHKYQAIFFDEQFARLRGIHVERHYIGLLCLVAAAIVLLITIAGSVLLIALLILPAAIATSFSHRFWQMMLWAVVLCFAFGATGLALSYAWDLPTGPTIIMVAGVAYFLSLGSKSILMPLYKRR